MTASAPIGPSLVLTPVTFPPVIAMPVTSTPVRIVAPCRFAAAANASTVLVGFAWPSVGQYDAAEGDEALVEEDVNEHRYRKLVVRDGVLRGAILIGWPDLVEPVCKGVKAGRDASPVMDAVRASDWSALAQP